MISVTTSTGTVTLTDRGSVGRPVVHLDWLCSSGGVVAAVLNDVKGVIERVTFVPDAGGTQPSAAYDVTLTDIEGIDVLAGLGGNLSQSAASSVVPQILNTVGTPTNTYAIGHKIAVSGALTLAIANAGNAKGGIIVIYLSEGR